MKQIPFLLCLFSFSFLVSEAQDKKAIKLYNEARQSLSLKEYDKALELLEKSMKRDPSFGDAPMLAGEIWYERKEVNKANEYFERAYTASRAAPLAFRIGMLNFKAGLYEKAEQYLQWYVDDPKAREAYSKEASKTIENCQFAQEAIAHPIEFNPINLGPFVNTEAMEYFPSISGDGQFLVLTYRDIEGKKKDEDFYATTRTAQGWDKAKPLQGRLNSLDNEGAQTVSADGLQLIFTACNRLDGAGSCDLYSSVRLKDGSWSTPINMGDSINSFHWETQPSLSPNGKMLYFVRGKKSEDGSSDIYYSERKNQYWTKAMKLEGPINTPGKECTPFIHFDNRTLYFASDGHKGMGDLDLYVSYKQEDGRWGEPKNLGYPTNSIGDQLGMVVSLDGKTAYYSSDMEGGFGLMELYYFNLQQEVSATPSAFIRGRVTDKESKKPIQARLLLTNLETGEEYQGWETNEEGYFFSVLPGNQNYALSIQKEAYLFHSESFHLEGNSEEKAYEKNIQLQQIETGSVVRLNNVFFETASFSLRPESNKELDILLRLIEANPTLRFSIEDHTDNIGGEQENQLLSENRAKSVVNYLVERGVSKKQLVWKGFGESKPIGENDTEEGRQLNRRTEVRIL